MSINGQFTRVFIDGSGSDVTASAIAFLAAGNEFWMRNLYLIGEAEDPGAYWLTDHEAPLTWTPWGTFQPSVIKRGSISTRIGLQVGTMQVDWSPNNFVLTNNISTMNPYQLALANYFDNVRLRCWKVLMPTPGDANTFGACDLFGGRIGQVDTEDALITMQVRSFLDVVNQSVPTNVIENTDQQASYVGATPPTGLSQIPQFNVINGSTQTKLILAQTSPSAGGTFSNNALRDGFVVFNRTSGMTLAGQWSGIYANTVVNISSVNYNEVILFNPLPFPPTPGVDTCYISGRRPVDGSAAGAVIWPYVPAPTTI